MSYDYNKIYTYPLWKHMNYRTRWLIEYMMGYTDIVDIILGKKHIYPYSSWFYWYQTTINSRPQFVYMINEYMGSSDAATIEWDKIEWSNLGKFLKWTAENF